MKGDVGYEFVPLPDRVNRINRPALRLDRRLKGALFGRIVLTYRCDRPVHVGSGFKDVVNGQVVRTMVKSGEHSIVPGSSMKGALRARFEAITLSCVPHGPPCKNGKQTNRSGLSKTHFAVKHAVLERAAADHDAFRRRCTRNAACPACALFGFQHGSDAFRGRVTVTDFAPLQGEVEHERIPQQWEPRLHHCAEARDYTVSGDTIRIHRLKGRKFHRGKGEDPPGPKMMIEVLPAGTLLRGELRLFNVTPEELGGLIAAAGFSPGSYVKVGAGKGLGFGRLCPESVEWHLRDALGGAVRPEPPNWCAAFHASRDRFAEGEQALVALHAPKDT